jgi:hypothetical protein
VPLPWLSPANPIRVGAAATLAAPVILEWRNSTWKLQPTHRVSDAGADVATFANTRPANASPQPVGGDLKLGTFNVLNYFNTTGQDYVAHGGTCSYYTDRDQDPVTVNTCTGPSGEPGPRGAAELEDLQRQQAKIVSAINGLGADIVSLEELENSIKLVGETDRDDAVRELVGALNAAAGAGTWAYVASPAEATTPDAVAQQDVIRSGFIYRRSAVETVGESDLLLDTTAFANAREPLAQAFKPAGAPDSAAFAVVVNHFKSKGDSTPPATGDNANGPQGAFNGDRVRQARAVAAFAQQFATDHGLAKIFLDRRLQRLLAGGPDAGRSTRGGVTRPSSPTRPETRSPTPSAGCRARSTTSSPTTRPGPRSPAPTCGTSTPTSRWPSSTAADNYNATQFYAPDRSPPPTTTPSWSSGCLHAAGARDHRRADPGHQRLPRPDQRHGAEAGAAVMAGAVKQLKSTPTRTPSSQRRVT